MSRESVVLRDIMARVNAALDHDRARKQAFEAGKRSADFHVATLRNELNRWRREAEFWKQEYRQATKEHCDFVMELVDRFGIAERNDPVQGENLEP